MDNKKTNYMQCQNCGKIFRIDKEVSIEELIVNAECPECGYTRALNCGDNEDDIILYANINLDKRYFIY